MFLTTLLQIVSNATVAAGDSLSKTVAAPPAALTNLPETAPKEETLSLLDMVMKGGYIMIPIGILSLIAFYFIVERTIVISRASRSERNFMNTIRDFMVNG